METKDADQSKERAGITKKSSYAKHIGIEVVSSAWNQLPLGKEMDLTMHLYKEFSLNLVQNLARRDKEALLT